MTENEPVEVGYDRPGFLTKKDRQFLREDVDDVANAEKRRRIRQRTKSAFLDFALLFEELSANDRAMIFEEYDDQKVGNPLADDFDEPDLHDGVVSAMAFICLGLADHWPPRRVTAGHKPPSGDYVRKFNSAVREALSEAYPRLGLALQGMDIDIVSMNQSDVEALKEEIKTGRREVTPDDVRLLYEAGDISRDRLEELARDELVDEEE
jgi:hypothetical protein